MVESFSAQRQLEELDAYINDPRGRIATGFPSLDKLLRRGGLATGTFCLFGGRTRTRKTTAMCNMIVSMLRSGVRVGLVGLDEAHHSYIIKLMSAALELDMEFIETDWRNLAPTWRDRYQSFAASLNIYGGYQADAPDDLDAWFIEAEVRHGGTPQVVFIDYTSKLKRRNFDGNEATRIEKLTQRLHTWTKERGVVTIALHQVGRLDEGTGLRYHGETPMTLEGLRYGGEAEADIVFATYRPALDPFGNMRYDMARRFKGSSFDEAEWQAARESVRKYRDYTFLQLLKNRPGTKTNEEGIPLRSVRSTMRMVEDFSVLEEEAFPDYAAEEDDGHEEARAFGGGTSPPTTGDARHHEEHPRPRQKASVPTLL